MDANAFSHQNILPPRAPVNVMSAMSSKQTNVLARQGSMLQNPGQLAGRASSTSQSNFYGGARSHAAGAPNARQSNSNIDMDIRIKGKSSIRTLIRLANTRAVDEGNEAQE